MIELLEARRLAVGVFELNQDVGAPAQSGSASYANGTYTVTAAGTDIGGNSDQFHFVHNALVGNGSIVADVRSLTHTANSAKAGVMVRNGTGAGAAFAGIFVTPASGIVFLARGSDGAAASQTISFGFAPPRFVRLTRGGADVTAHHSANGVDWIQVGTAQTITLGSESRVGLAVTSRNASTTTTATFDNVSLLLPDGWTDTDVGDPPPASPGWAFFDPSTSRFTISGGGGGFGGTSDQFNFLSRTMSGDGEIVALVDEAAGHAAPAGRFGLMIRDDSAADARFAAVSLAANDSLVFQWRASPGAAASSVTVPGIDGPVWLRLVHDDGRFTAHYSTAGAGDWTPIGAAQSIAMTRATTFAGLAVSSHDPALLAEGTFASASLVQEDWTRTDIGSPAARGSAVFDPPSNTYAVSGAGAGIAGASDQFTFASRPMSGDGSVTAYVNSLSAEDPAAQAGVMFRASDAPDAPFAAVLVTAQGELVFAWRTTAGAAVEQSIPLAIAAPVSLRLTRTGNSFNPTYSTNGVNFLPVGPTRTVVMPSTVRAGVALASGHPAQLATAAITGAFAGRSLPPGAGIYSAADELFLHDLEQRSVRFFFDETNPNTGMVPDGSNANGGSPSSVSSIAATGFGLTALTIGDRHGWLTHAEAYQRALNTVNFLRNNAAQVQGFFYHFLNPVTGAREWNSELSSIDTALLMAGVLNVAEHWEGTAVETVARDVFNRVNWPFMLMPNGQYFGHWTPEGGFGGGYVDFSEAVLLYMLGIASPTHPAPLSTWTAWPRTPVINYDGFTFVTATTRALFTVQYPQAWFDLRGLADSTGLNYYVNSQFATQAQRQMFINLQPTWPQYGANNWGATAADGPNGYTVWGGPPPTGNIDGSVVPTAPGGSLAFTPRYSADALRHMRTTYGGTVYRKYGFVDAFNPHTSWTSQIVLGIDVGMMLIAAENSRSNFVWDVFRQSSVARQAVASAFPSVRPELLAATSRKPGPGGINLDLPIELQDEGSKAVENRQGGPTQIVLNFGANVVKGANFSIALTTAAGGPNGSVSSSSVSGSTLTINLANVLDARTLVVNINDLRHHPGSAGGNYSLRLDVLLGDANQDGRVNLNDFNILAANFGQSPRDHTQGDFTFDQVVNLNDFNLLAGQFGKSLSTSSTASAGFALVGSNGALDDDEDDDEDPAQTRVTSEAA